jgi:3-oxoacyl-[acyl-carrier-protein] synthase-1
LAGFPLIPLWIPHFTATSAIGRGLPQTLAALRQSRGGLVPCAFDTVDLPTFIGEVPGVDGVELPAELSAFDCRNNRLAFLGLMQDGLPMPWRGSPPVRRATSAYSWAPAHQASTRPELAYRGATSIPAPPADFVCDTTHQRSPLRFHPALFLD